MAYLNFQNCTRQEYETTLYSQQAQHKIKILFNNVELQDADRYCEKVTIKSRIIPNGAKRFSLNNFISKEVELILHDINTNIIQDQISISIGTLVNNTYEYVPIGIFNIQDTPTNDKNKTTIKLRDNSVKFDFNYNAKPLLDENGGTATKLQILQDICTKAGITCNISSFIGSTDLVGVYDNTITARQYIADLAENAGRIATINRNGELIFININSLTTWNIPLSIVEKYEKGKEYRIGQVIYEDGVRKYETSDTNYDVLFLEASNPYIYSQSQVNSILQQVNSFVIDSISTGLILGNPAIDGYDLINVYDDKASGNPSVFKTLATYDLIYNGILKSTYDTQIGEEEREQNVSILGEPTFKKWAKTEINNINGEVLIQSGKIDTLEKETNPTGEESASSFYLEDSADADLLDFELEGKTTQETRSGKNLLYNNGIDSTSSDVVFTKNADGSISITGSNNTDSAIIYNICTRGSNLFVLNAGSYILNGCTDGSSSTYSLYVSDGTNSYYNYDNETTFTVANDNSPFGAYIRIAKNSTVNTTIYPMVRLSSITDDTYEPYGVMPSPDYPSELISVGYKNLFDKSLIPSGFAKDNGVILTRGDGTYRTVSINLPTTLPAGTYTLNYKIKDSTLTSLGNSTVYFYNGSTQIVGRYIVPFGLTFTANNQLTRLQFAIASAETSTATITFDDIILTKGAAKGEYVPYDKYGISIKTIGKNLFSGLFKGLVVSSTNGSESYNDNSSASDFIAVDFNQNTSYYLSGLTNTIASFVCAYNKDKQFLGRTGAGGRTSIALYDSSFTSGTPQATGDIAYIRVRHYVSGTGSIDDIDNLQIQLEIGNYNTQYQQYKSNTKTYEIGEPLRSIGDIKDKLYIENSNLYIQRKIKSVILNGSESGWGITSSGTANYFYRYRYLQDVGTKGQGKYYSNNFSFKSISSSNTDEGMYITGGNELRLRFGTEMTLADFKTWLSTHNTEIQYLLETPAIEELGKVDIPNTYKGITHIDLIDNTPSIMNIKYVKDTQISNYVEEHISEIKITEDSITSRVESIENNGLDERVNAVEVKQTSTDETISIISTNIDQTTGDINSVTTKEKKFTFNDSGLTITNSLTNFKSLQDETGTYYYDGTNIVGKYTKDGSMQKDLQLFGVYYYGMNDVNDNPRFVAQLYTDSDNEECFGHFWNGGDY